MLERHTAGSEEIDFAFANLPGPLAPMFQQLAERPWSARIVRECERLTLMSDLRETPVPGRAYGFAGQVTEQQSGGFWIAGETQIEPHMTFDRADDTRYIFRLTHAHPGDEQYKGCSGAPICDADGTLVSVVLGGDPLTSEIYGAPLGRYRAAIEQTLQLPS